MSEKIALITGASKGFGYALAKSLASKGWKLLITARNSSQLFRVKTELSTYTEVIAVSGDVRDEVHLLELAQLLMDKSWKLDLLVNNASALGPSPMLPLFEHPIEQMHIVLHTNMIAPISLLQKVKDQLQEAAKIINLSSDAAVEAYESWGVYGASKAGLDHMSAILGKENPQYRFYAFDPGDMRTDMHQAAFPQEDISDRPSPEEFALPAILKLIENDLPGGRYTPQLQAEKNYENLSQ